MSTTHPTPATAVQPYITLYGRCEEALEFYTRAIGAQVDVMMRFKDAPEPPPPGMLPEGYEEKIMHASFRVGDSVIMAADGCSSQSEEKPQGYSLAIQIANEAEANRYFDALKEGGEVTMPLGKTFWSPRFGMLTDKFGIGWMVNVCVDVCTPAQI